MAKSTKIIAALGVAGMLGTIALPMASYADDVTDITDSIKVTVAQTCGFTTESSATNTNGTFEGNAANGHEVEDFGTDTHKFNIVCNANKGYVVKAYATGLASATDTIDYTNSYTATGTDGQWTAIVTDGNSGASIAAGTGADHATKLAAANTIKSRSSATTTDGESFTVQYKVYVGTSTDAGTYTGSVVYNVAPGV